MDDTTLGKTGHLAMPTSRLSTAAALPSPQLAPHRAAGSRQTPSPFTWGPPPTTQQLHAAMRGGSQSLSPVAVRSAVATDCDPEKMVCTTDAGQPHGGKLINTYVESEAERKKLVDECAATIELSERQACDVASLITGAFSPLTGFMKKADYDSVVTDMRTKDGNLFGLPVVLDVSEPGLQGKKILLKYQGIEMAVMDVEEEWEPDKPKEAEKSTERPRMSIPPFTS